jgi:hypothetical protein
MFVILRYLLRRLPATHSDCGRQVRPIHLLACSIHSLYKAIVNLQPLRYFAIVIEELNFTRAAERLHMAHSLLSYQLGHLEDEPAGEERLTALRGTGSRDGLARRAREHDSWREPCRTPQVVPTPDTLFERENT